ncbi:MAG: adenylate kinase [Candidatus Micrarchaeota archaeon]
MIILLLGPPGAGKGMQANLLSAEFRIPHMSTGRIFRKEIVEETSLGLKAKEFVQKGNYVPDSLVLEIVKKRIEKPNYKNGFILDGFPRTISQAKGLDALLEEKGLKIKFVINLDIPENVVIDRITYRSIIGEEDERKDDSPEVVKKRIDTYYQETKPLINYYKERGVLSEINGNQNVVKVFSEINEVIQGK